MGGLIRDHPSLEIGVNIWILNLDIGANLIFVAEVWKPGDQSLRWLFGNIWGSVIEEALWEIWGSVVE